MGLNLPDWFFPLLALVAFAAVVLGIVEISRKSRNTEKTNDKKAIVYRAVTVLCVVIMLASWIVNIGWYRIILTWIPIPLIHTVAFIIINFKAISNISRSDKLKKYIPWSWGTYLTSYLLFPDGGDDGGVRAFFNLIQNDALCTIAMCAAIICFCANVAVLSLEYDDCKKIKAKK